MCKWNNGGVPLPMPKWLMPEKENRTVCIDECIVDVLQELWRNHVYTLGCCCGHGKANPSLVVSEHQDIHKAFIVLRECDKREWVVSRWELQDYSFRVHGMFKAGLDRDIGKSMREMRVRSGLSLRKLAVALGLSAPYVSDLELGRRHWNMKMYQRYDNALKGAINEMANGSV